jgi:glycogen synthase
VPDPRRRLRVAILARSVFPLHGYGGLERHVGDLVVHLLRLDVGVTLLTRPIRREGRSGRDALIAPFLAQPSLEVECIPYRTFPLAGRRGTTVLDRSSAYLWFGRKAGRRAAKLAADGEVAIVHGLGASALGYAQARQHRRARAPFVFNPQGLEEFVDVGSSPASAGAAQRVATRLKRIAYRPLQRAVRTCAAAADRVIATDTAIVPAVRTHLRVEPARIAIVPNAIDIEALDRGAAAPRPRSAAVALLLSVGRLEHNKGFHVLVDALAGLRDRTDWRWVLVGDGPYRRRLEALVARRGLADRVDLVGRAEDPALHAWYRAADLFVHPTLYEGSSLVTLEAMAHGTAVVATRAGGLPDKVQPGVTGWLVEPGDAAALRGALAHALDHREGLPGMGLAGRAVVEQRFSWTIVARQTLELYHQLIARG